MKKNNQIVVVEMSDLANLFGAVLHHTGQPKVEFNNCVFNVYTDEWELAVGRAQEVERRMNPWHYTGNALTDGNRTSIVDLCPICNEAVDQTSCVMHDGSMYHIRCWRG